MSPFDWGVLVGVVIGAAGTLVLVTVVAGFEEEIKTWLERLATWLAGPLP